MLFNFLTKEEEKKYAHSIHAAHYENRSVHTQITFASSYQPAKRVELTLQY